MTSAVIVWGPIPSIETRILLDGDIVFAGIVFSDYRSIYTPKWVKRGSGVSVYLND